MLLPGFGGPSVLNCKIAEFQEVLQWEGGAGEATVPSRAQRASGFCCLGLDVVVCQSFSGHNLGWNLPQKSSKYNIVLKKIKLKITPGYVLTA